MRLWALRLNKNIKPQLRYSDTSDNHIRTPVYQGIEHKCVHQTYYDSPLIQSIHTVLGQF